MKRSLRLKQKFLFVLASGCTLATAGCSDDQVSSNTSGAKGSKPTPAASQTVASQTGAPAKTESTKQPTVATAEVSNSQLKNQVNAHETPEGRAQAIKELQKRGGLTDAELVDLYKKNIAAEEQNIKVMTSVLSSSASTENQLAKAETYLVEGKSRLTKLNDEMAVVNARIAETNAQLAESVKAQKQADEQKADLQKKAAIELANQESNTKRAEAEKKGQARLADIKKSVEPYSTDLIKTELTHFSSDKLKVSMEILKSRGESNRAIIDLLQNTYSSFVKTADSYAAEESNRRRVTRDPKPKFDARVPEMNKRISTVLDLIDQYESQDLKDVEAAANATIPQFEASLAGLSKAQLRERVNISLTDLQLKSLLVAMFRAGSSENEVLNSFITLRASLADRGAKLESLTSYAQSRSQLTQRQVARWKNEIAERMKGLSVVQKSVRDAIAISRGFSKAKEFVATSIEKASQLFASAQSWAALRNERNLAGMVNSLDTMPSTFKISGPKSSAFVKDEAVDALFGHAMAVSILRKQLQGATTFEQAKDIIESAPRAIPSGVVTGLIEEQLETARGVLSYWNSQAGNSEMSDVQSEIQSADARVSMFEMLKNSVSE